MACCWWAQAMTITDEAPASEVAPLSFTSISSWASPCSLAGALVPSLSPNPCEFHNQKLHVDMHCLLHSRCLLHRAPERRGWPRSRPQVQDLLQDMNSMWTWQPRSQGPMSHGVGLNYSASRAVTWSCSMKLLVERSEICWLVIKPVALGCFLWLFLIQSFTKPHQD